MDEWTAHTIAERLNRWQCVGGGSVCFNLAGEGGTLYVRGARPELADDEFLISIREPAMWTSNEVIAYVQGWFEERRRAGRELPEALRRRPDARVEWGTTRTCVVESATGWIGTTRKLGASESRDTAKMPSPVAAAALILPFTFDWLARVVASADTQPSRSDVRRFRIGVTNSVSGPMLAWWRSQPKEEARDGRSAPGWLLWHLQAAVTANRVVLPFFSTTPVLGVASNPHPDGVRPLSNFLFPAVRVFAIEVR